MLHLIKHSYVVTHKQTIGKANWRSFANEVGNTLLSSVCILHYSIQLLSNLITYGCNKLHKFLCIEGGFSQI